MEVLSIVGARPQFIKASPVSDALARAGHRETLLHTGQHYDRNMSGLFFDELGMRPPDVNLGIGSGSHGEQTGRMLPAIEQAILQHRPDWVVVYGDTNSTLAGALVACKIPVPLAHVEAGLRSFNRAMPEEHNRVVTDHCSDLLFCPTRTAVANLAHEGLARGVHLVGDTMLDAILRFAEVAAARSTILENLGLEQGGYLVATVHRPCNTDDPATLSAILSALADLDEPVILPAHPRLRDTINDLEIGLPSTGRLRVIDPVGYLDMLALQRGARMILTDSGGMQKEALFLGVPCVTLRPETEWVETVEEGWNLLVGADGAAIRAAVRDRRWPTGSPPSLFGDGKAAERIVETLEIGV